MLKVFRRRWFMLTLPGLLVLVVFLIGGGLQSRFTGPPTVAAADRQAAGGDSGCTGEHHSPSFGSTVVVNSGEVICSNLTSFGGIVVIRGEVRGDVVAFGGKVVIDGRVDGNVTQYVGNVTLQDSADVSGDIHLCGGRWTHSQNSQLHGSVLDCTNGMGQLLAGDVGTGFRFWSIVTWVALGLLLTSLLPEHVMLVHTTAKSKMRRSLVLGLLSVLLAPAVLAVLVALIIPIPLAILVAIGLVAAWALGTVAVGWLIGEYILRKITPQQNTRPMQVVVGLTVLTLAGSLPYVGWLVWISTGLLGIGAVFLSRFGTRLYSQPKQPLQL
ncbi:polymer-forming cytoskeletal protein [Ktedonosporobacter rubrisoli]|uniref:Polymer-forming cytoskeletal protein n=1 Tax=Ktedonosporobacter rubrisoli TaxID=2509675 RepID=A0A4P6K159_KTERU|nr:polymer-forming cytoskeletal protein [Ktedonosporobacter rubrisoli]QBD81390.1 polymer-forming cytoskeletal protein [Ktedonosporobacter rubrisoli]